MNLCLYGIQMRLHRAAYTTFPSFINSIHSKDDSSEAEIVIK
jgi:hypothetical protein